MKILNSMGSMTFPDVRGVEQIDLPGYGWLDVAGTSDDALRIMEENREGSFLLLEGGADINPALYGEENLYSAPSLYRDRSEIAFYRKARELGIPVLGICRGHQLMAALEGGTLYQDISRQVGAGHSYVHRITHTDLSKACGFYKLMESTPLGSPYRVNSMHHQGIKDMPPSGEILARAHDGVVEAVLYPFGLSVQWHPEFQGHIEFIDYMRRFMETSNEPANNRGLGDRVSAPAKSGGRGDQLATV